MAHPVCDFAHHMTRVALGGTGIMLSDGATNVMPVGPHRGDKLTAKQKKENPLMRECIVCLYPIFHAL